MKWIVPALVLVAGCAARTQVDVGAGTPQSGVQLHVEGGRGLAALLGLSILAAGIYEAERYGPDSPRREPELAPGRRIAEQDCTRPLENLSGNLKCR